MYSLCTRSVPLPPAQVAGTLCKAVYVHFAKDALRLLIVHFPILLLLSLEQSCYIVFLIVRCRIHLRYPSINYLCRRGRRLTSFPSIVCCNFLFRDSFAGEKEVSLTLGRRRYLRILEERFAGHLPISPQSLEGAISDNYQSSPFVVVVRTHQIKSLGNIKEIIKPQTSIRTLFTERQLRTPTSRLKITVHDDPRTHLDGHIGCSRKPHLRNSRCSRHKRIKGPINI